jgi:hypothetical protein
VREQLGDDKPWEGGSPTLPTKPVVWTTVPRAAGGDRRQGPQDDSGGGPPDHPPDDVPPPVPA